MKLQQMADQVLHSRAKDQQVWFLYKLDVEYQI